MEEEEKFPRYKAEIHTHPKRSVTEKGSSMEEKKEALPHRKVSLLHFRLETWHFYLLKSHGFQLFSGRECANARPHQEFMENIIILH